MKKEISYRQLGSEPANFRALTEGEGRNFVGYAALFNVRSKLISENGKNFYEYIAPGAFDEVLATNPDVRLNYNHQRTALLARTSSQTLALSTDAKGLLINASIPNTTLGNDTYEMVTRGDLYEMSFAFGVKKGDDTWTKDENGVDVRTINKISTLYDVSIVVDGAYANTTISTREEKTERGTCITIEIEIDGEEESEEPELEIAEPAAISEDPLEEDSCEDPEKEKMRMRMHILQLRGGPGSGPQPGGGKGKDDGVYSKSVGLSSGIGNGNGIGKEGGPAAVGEYYDKATPAEKMAVMEIMAGADYEKFGKGVIVHTNTSQDNVEPIKYAIMEKVAAEFGLNPKSVLLANK